MKRLPLLFLILYLFSFQSIAQDGDLTKHEPFFTQQGALYQSWLNRTGLSQAFILHDVQVRAEGVALNLRFTATKADSIAASWFAAKAAFEEKNLIELEEALFLKMLRLFDLQSEQAFVQIKNTYSVLGDKYYVKIYTMKGHLKVKRNFSKGYFGKTDILLKQTVCAQSEEGLAGHDDKKKVYALVQQFTKEYYGQYKRCSGKVPVVDAFYSLSDKLLVNISGLCKVVLTEGEESLFCDVLNRLKWDCEDVKRESLSFEFDFDTESSKLYCQLDGKYSNNYYLYQGEARDMDDDPAFERLLESHGEQFLKDFKLWID